jgi:steroid 5-alpha reductase family enzyme
MRRKDPDKFWWKSYIRVFLLQGVLMLIICAPIVTLMASSTEGPSYWSIMGFLLWAVGFFFEAVGDLQLKKFKQNPSNKGKLLTTGLWSLTRHPNYFGDACQWWGFGVFAFTIQPYGFLSFLGPIFMTLLIIKVSGVDLLEKSLATSKPGYREYVKNVPSFIPRFPFRKKTS